MSQKFLYNSVITGCGGYVPQNKITNDDLAKFIETSDEWISTRTGIKQRFKIGDNELTSDMAYWAAKEAIENSGVDKNLIDMIIIATTTPDRSFPQTASYVQQKLGIKKAAAFDVQSVCAGFVYALSIADSFIKTGNAKKIIVIGVDAMTKLLDWNDRSTCVLFGDGAGAVIIEANSNDVDRGILHSKIYNDGELANILYCSGGVCATGQSGVIKMNGTEVFKHAVNKMIEVSEEILALAKLTVEDVDYFVPHQANKRIIDAVAKKLNFPTEKVALTVDKYANTSAATIPLALNDMVKSNKIKAGDLVLTSAVGGGLSWGGNIIRW